jgi:branched-chain amino acid transport system ATP-binding protein
VNLLEVRGLHAGYGQGLVLEGIEFTLAAGEVVALLGRNGSGRSTLAKALMGLVERRGEIVWQGRQISGLATFEIARLGLGYVPESRDVFPGLSVAQNLSLGHRPGSRCREADIYALFPALQARQRTAAGLLSGGEQQMLALGRSLMGDPQLLIIDEPTEGLAPQVVAQVADFLKALRLRGVAVLLIEQKLDMALAVSDRVLVMGHGRIVHQGDPRSLMADRAVCREWLEV